MRAVLLTKMRESTSMRPVVSPWAHLFFSKRVQASFLSVVIILGYGSSVALAAEGALPGDILYPVKTRVTEPVVRLVTVSTPAEEAKFETKLLERRLEEAETLETDKKLGPELRHEVRESVRAQSVKAKMKSKDAEDGDIAGSAALSVVASTTTATSTQKAKTEKVREEKQREKGDNESVTKERGKSERALNAVLQKHERTLENLDLEGEQIGKSGASDHENGNRGNGGEGRGRD